MRRWRVDGGRGRDGGVISGGPPPETGKAAEVAGANSGGVAVVEPRKKMSRWV